MKIVIYSRNKNVGEIYFLNPTPERFTECMGHRWDKRTYKEYVRNDDKKETYPVENMTYHKYTKQHNYLQQLTIAATELHGIVMVGNAYNAVHGTIDLPDKYKEYVEFAFKMDGKTFSRFYTYMNHKLKLNPKRAPTLDEGMLHYKDFDLTERFNKVI